MLARDKTDETELCCMLLEPSWHPPKADQAGELVTDSVVISYAQTVRTQFCAHEPTWSFLGILLESASAVSGLSCGPLGPMLRPSCSICGSSMAPRKRGRQENWLGILLLLLARHRCATGFAPTSRLGALLEPYWSAQEPSSTSLGNLCDPCWAHLAASGAQLGPPKADWAGCLVTDVSWRSARRG